MIQYNSGMRSRLKNVTVALREDVARWARIEAARHDRSVSRLISELLQEEMEQQDSYEGAMRRALARKPFLSTDGVYLSREEVHGRTDLR